jgi:hypothetical protein
MKNIKIMLAALVLSLGATQLEARHYADSASVDDVYVVQSCDYTNCFQMGVNKWCCPDTYQISGTFSAPVCIPSKNSTNLVTTSACSKSQEQTPTVGITFIRNPQLVD